MQGYSNGSDGEVILTGRLAEFRIALLQEIDAASRQEASSAVPLANGRRIGQVGGSFQYIFDIESSLNLPGDAPGDLLIPGRSPIEVVVVAVDGMVITLGVPEDLGPAVPSARLQSNLALLMRRLIARIEEKAEIPNPTGDRVLQGEAHGAALKVDLASFKLNHEQSEAVETSLGFDVTFIQGPPGTGKTRTIGALATSLFRAERSVLLVSHTNIAVDQALLKMADHIGAEEREAGLVVRVGTPKDTQLLEHPDLLLSTHVEKRSKALVDRRAALESNREQATEEVKGICRNIELCEWVGQAKGDIEQMGSDLTSLHEKEVEVDGLSETLTQLELQRDYWSTARTEAQAAKKNAQRLAETDETVRSTRVARSECEANLGRLAAELSAARVLLGQTCSAGWLMRKWRGWPTPDEQTKKVQELENSLAERTAESDLLREHLATAEAERDHLEELIRGFRIKHRLEPDGLLSKTSAYEAKVEQTKTSVHEARRRFQSEYVRLRNLLKTRLAALIQLELAEESPESTDGMFEQIQRAYECAGRITRGMNLTALTARRDALNADITRIEVELQVIEEDLKRVAELVIADAKVVATTLTRAYLRDAIQGRRFDTVIVDEASMAPIPALWVAASVATSAAVIVGDPQQLPPIVISTHDLAEKWLGRDVFEVAGVTRQHPCFKQLREQYRMHPAISAVPNALIYRGELRDAEGTRDDGNLGLWYRYDWGHDSPLLLVDTGSLHAWVTSIPRNKGSSRLNFLSAAVCLDIAE
jgi:DNA polymerase III delta prime subunit